jgi:hypothetical protein
MEMTDGLVGWELVVVHGGIVGEGRVGKVDARGTCWLDKWGDWEELQGMVKGVMMGELNKVGGAKPKPYTDTVSEGISRGREKK